MAETVYEPDVGRLAEIRATVRSTLLRWSVAPDGDLAAATVLVANELATNAIVHARTSFTVSVQVARGAVRVEVRDRSRVPPAPAAGTANRGLMIVSRLSAGWGVVDHVDGKTVWAEIWP